MSKACIKVFLMVCLAGFSISAAADDRDRRGGWEAGNSGSWRLGSDRGHDRYGIYYRDGRGWRRMPGSATDVGDGWVIGTDRRSGGYGIYRWNGRRWERVSGGAVQIGGTYERPWVINNRNEKFIWNGYDWDEVRNSGRRYSDDRYQRIYPRPEQRRRNQRGRW